MTYIVTIYNHDHQKHLERLTDEQWEVLDPVIKNNPKKFVYATKEIDDPQLAEFKEITWTRIEVPNRTEKTKITVPFTPDNIPLMEEAAVEQAKRILRRVENIQKIKEISNNEIDPISAKNSDIYAISITQHNNAKNLERFSKEKWEYIPLPKRNDTEKYPFYSNDIKSSEFAEFKEIIWERVYNPWLRINAKIIVPFTPDDIPLMERNAIKEIEARNKKWKKTLAEQMENHEKAIQRRKEKNLAKLESHIKAKSENDKYFTDDMCEYDAILKWKELDFIMPPPQRILDIKNSYNIRWEQFIMICRQMQ